MHMQPQRLSVKRKVRKAEKEFTIELSNKKCLVCGEIAEYCMRGLPNNAYCKECAQNYFKLLSYLEKL